jgi:adenylate cyclase
MQVVLHLWGVPVYKVRFEDKQVIIPHPDGHEVTIPVDDHKRILLNFRYPWPNPTMGEVKTRNGNPDNSGFVHVNYWRLIDGFDRLRNERLAGEQPADSTSSGSFFDPRTLDGKILIIGSSAQATHDLRATPIDERYPMVGTVGEIIRSIQQEDFLLMAPPWLNSLWIIGGTFLVGLLGQFFAPLKHALVTFVISGAHAFSSYFLFAWFGIVVDFFHVSIAEIVAYAVVTLVQYLQVSSIFGRYVTPGVRRYLLSNRQALELGGQETEVSILFSDLSGFTSMSEKMEASAVISLLNEYFGPMFKIIIDEEQGTLDKLIGDAIMAYFGHPQPMPDHAGKAVTAALKMQRRLAELRELWIQQGKPPIRMRIGVNTGPVVAGNMGDRYRTDYSIIGDSVNLASRLESNAPVDGVLISETTYHLVKDQFHFKERDPIHVKNKELPVKVYEVLDFI